MIDILAPDPTCRTCVKICRLRAAMSQHELDCTTDCGSYKLTPKQPAPVEGQDVSPQLASGLLLATLTKLIETEQDDTANGYLVDSFDALQCYQNVKRTQEQREFDDDVPPNAPPVPMG